MTTGTRGYVVEVVAVIDAKASWLVQTVVALWGLYVLKRESAGGYNTVELGRLTYTFSDLPFGGTIT